MIGLFFQNYEIPFSTREVTVEELEPDTRYEIDVIGVIEISDGVTVQSLPGSDFKTTSKSLYILIRVLVTFFTVNLECIFC